MLTFTIPPGIRLWICPQALNSRDVITINDIRSWLRGFIFSP
jgi:hypothetical protein